MKNVRKVHALTFLFATRMELSVTSFSRQQNGVLQHYHLLEFNGTLADWNCKVSGHLLQFPVMNLVQLGDFNAPLLLFTRDWFLLLKGLPVPWHFLTKRSRATVIWTSICQLFNDQIEMHNVSKTCLRPSLAVYPRVSRFVQWLPSSETGGKKS